MRDNADGLLEQARRGDVDAFAAVFEDLRPAAFGVAARLVGAEDANDVVMDTYLKAWQALPGFRGQSTLKTWLYRITRNCALDHLRKRRREGQHVVAEPEDFAERGVEDERQLPPDRQMEADELRDFVRAGLSRLSPDHRLALELRYGDGLSYAELAAATGVSIGTVMSRLFHARRRLRSVLRSSGGARTGQRSPI
jgi:RNA polymerase sigma-70 factor (ECF subfamily)